ncbi:outer membrane protein assembly factor BamD [bacterium MnTg03]|nr:outer membrane protein assembly factor BamD [bacterium MnTg03]
MTASCLLLLACGPAKEVDVTAGWSAETLYRSAKNEMANKNYSTAIEQYQILESRYPFGKYATQAQLDVGYAYYKFEEVEAAIAALDRFIKLNPRHEAVDYAYYLKGLANFNRGKSLLDNIYYRDKADYDKSILLTSYNDFQILLRRFPRSKYAVDSRQHLIYLRDKLASADLKIARFYASRDAWVAASNRAKFIILSYPGTDAVQPALEIQLAAYQHLGLDRLAADTQRIIDLNYSDGS